MHPPFVSHLCSHALCSVRSEVASQQSLLEWQWSNTSTDCLVH